MKETGRLGCSGCDHNNFFHDENLGCFFSISTPVYSAKVSVPYNVSPGLSAGVSQSRRKCRREDNSGLCQFNS